MTPPLANEIARVYEHPDLCRSTDPVEQAFLRVKMTTLRDMELALTGKPEGPEGNKRLIQELKPAGPNGPLRIYYIIVRDAVVVLHWGSKHRQQADIDLARKRAVEVRGALDTFAIVSRKIA